MKMKGGILLVFQGLMTMHFFPSLTRACCLTSGQTPAPVDDVLPSENEGARKQWVCQTHCLCLWTSAGAVLCIMSK